MRNLILLMLLLKSFVGYTQGLSPSVINAAGFSAKNSSIQLTWNIGEPVTSTISTSGGMLTQGFLQSDQATITSVTHVPRIESISIYPNPVEEILYLKSSQAGNASIKITDITGKLILKRNLQGNSIDLSQLNQGLFILSVTDTKTNHTQTFKIIKKQIP